jgi:hypothetical protein
MKSIADQLPPETARQIHPDRRKNEPACWAARDQLLDQYRCRWIAFADGRVSVKFPSIREGGGPVSPNLSPQQTAVAMPFLRAIERRAPGKAFRHR